MNRIALLLLVAISVGCTSRVAEHCPSCTVIREGQRPPFPVENSDARAFVVLVHGAYGFGDEWDPVVAALRAQPDTQFVAFEWRGPWHELSGAVADLDGVIQRALDRWPRLTDVLVLAHSAGGPVATRALLGLKVPAGRRVKLAEIDSPTFMNGPPMFHPRMEKYPPMPPGVERIVYVAKDPPHGVGDGIPRVYLGNSVTHDQAVALAGLPLVKALAAP